MRRIGTVLLTFIVVGVLGTAVTTGSAAARGNVLPDATYEAIVQANDAMTDLNESNRSGMSDQEQSAEMRTVCRIFPTGDPLLENRREQCLATVKLLDLVTRECKTKRGCLRQLKRMDASYVRVYRLAVAGNRIADETVPAGACRTALRSTSSELRQFRETGRLYTAYLRAAIAEDKRAMKALEKRAERLGKLKVRTEAQIHKAVRTHC